MSTAPIAFACVVDSSQNLVSWLYLWPKTRLQQMLLSHSAKTTTTTTQFCTENLWTFIGQRLHNFPQTNYSWTNYTPLWLFAFSDRFFVKTHRLATVHTSRTERHNTVTQTRPLVRSAKTQSCLSFIVFSVICRTCWLPVVAWLMPGSH